jgi:hypothetical protein
VPTSPTVPEIKAKPISPRTASQTSDDMALSDPTSRFVNVVRVRFDDRIGTNIIAVHAAAKRTLMKLTPHKATTNFTTGVRAELYVEPATGFFIHADFIAALNVENVLVSLKLLIKASGLRLKLETILEDE